MNHRLELAIKHAIEKLEFATQNSDVTQAQLWANVVATLAGSWNRELDV